jgi:hypothetical protein
MAPRPVTAFGIWPPPRDPHRAALALAKLLWYEKDAFDHGAVLALEDGDALAVADAIPDIVDDETRGRLRLALGRPAPPGAATRGLWYAPSADEPPAWRRRALRRWDEIDPYAAQAWVAAVYDPATSIRPFDPAEFEGRRPVQLYGPGPSLGAVAPAEDSLTICVLTALPAFLEAYGEPDVVVATDAILLTGPTRVAARYRNAVQRAGGSVVIVPRPIGWLLSRHAPALAARLRGVEIVAAGTAGAAFVDTRNVLTTLALPLALGVSDQVELVGFDGPGRNGRWGHVDNRQRYRDLGDLRVAFPASGIDAHYYAEHLARLKSTLDREPKVRPHPASTLAAALHELPAGRGISPAKRPARWHYDLLDWCDRHPAASGAAAFLGVVLLCIAAYETEAAMLPIILIALVALNLALTVGAIFALRRRQKRLADMVEDRLSSRWSERERLMTARIESLESNYEG